MSVGKVTELTARSNNSFEDAIDQGVTRARKTLDNVKSAWVKEQQVFIDEDGREEYQVTMKVTFILNE